MRARLPCLIIAVVCSSVLLWQAAVSAGALQFCRCTRVDGSCPGCAKAAGARPAGCCAKPAESAADRRPCCKSERTGVAGCDCPAQLDETPMLERPRPRPEPVALPAYFQPEAPSAAAVDFRRPSVALPAVWPPGVRLQSLLCTWLI